MAASAQVHSLAELSRIGAVFDSKRGLVVREVALPEAAADAGGGAEGGAGGDVGALNSGRMYGLRCVFIRAMHLQQPS